MKKPESFLLVDDDADDALLFKETLESLDSGLNFQYAQNGLEALDLLQKKEQPLPDAIFLDLNMPRMNGIEFLTEIRKMKEFEGIPVIIYTTSLRSTDIEETIQKGAVCFIAKPTSTKELKKLLAFIAENLYDNFERKLNSVSGNFNTFIVC